ncbi:MAG: DNA-3-methyladenine glycosylase [Spirochaetales bacterium]|nr:DNA-3-methyladenine glycosylase [Spirochaetales bacterium]
MASLSDDSPLSQSFYDRDVVTVAQELIGCVLRRGTEDGTVLAGRIVETEAYRHDDPASHAYTGRSERNASMFGPPGHAYVYLIYGMYDCFNVVCGPPDIAGAVLIRAVEPTDGISFMWQNRFGSGGRPADSKRSLTDLTSGPGKLCRALRITRSEIDGASLESGPVTIHPPPLLVGRIVAARRIGISRAVDREWRFLESENPFVSRR